MFSVFSYQDKGLLYLCISKGIKVMIAYLTGLMCDKTNAKNNDQFLAFGYRHEYGWVKGRGVTGRGVR